MNVGEARGGPAEGKANEVHLMKKMSQIRLAVWCKGRIQVLVEVAVKGRRPLRPLSSQIFTVPRFFVSNRQELKRRKICGR